MPHAQTTETAVLEVQRPPDGSRLEIRAEVTARTATPARPRTDEPARHHTDAPGQRDRASDPLRARLRITVDEHVAARTGNGGEPGLRLTITIVVALEAAAAALGCHPDHTLDLLARRYRGRGFDAAAWALRLPGAEADTHAHRTVT